jgi:hypothetical protein
MSEQPSEASEQELEQVAGGKSRIPAVKLSERQPAQDGGTKDPEERKAFIVKIS